MRSCVDSEESSNWWKHFAINFAFDCFHVEKIEELLCVISIVETESKRQKKSSKKFWDFQSISRKSINLERERCESDSRSLCEEKVVWVDVEREKSSFCRRKDRAAQILDDDFISTSFADVVLLIDHYVRVKNFRNISFRRL
jgi:hypothetical protein